MARRLRPNLNKNVRDEILKAMKDQDISKSELADMMGVTAPTVYGFLQAGHNVTIDTLERVSKALNRKFVFRLDN